MVGLGSGTGFTLAPCVLGKGTGVLDLLEMEVVTINWSLGAGRGTISVVGVVTLIGSGDDWWSSGGDCDVIAGNLRRG